MTIWAIAASKTRTLQDGLAWSLVLCLEMLFGSHIRHFLGSRFARLKFRARRQLWGRLGNLYLIKLSHRIQKLELLAFF